MCTSLQKHLNYNKLAIDNHGFNNNEAMPFTIRQTRYFRFQGAVSFSVMYESLIKSLISVKYQKSARKL